MLVVVVVAMCNLAWGAISSCAVLNRASCDESVRGGGGGVDDWRASVMIGAVEWIGTCVHPRRVIAWGRVWCDVRGVMRGWV